MFDQLKIIGMRFHVIFGGFKSNELFFRPFSFFLNPFESLVQPTESAKLVVAVMSRLDHFDERSAIRKTWKKLKNAETSFYFVMPELPCPIDPEWRVKVRKFATFAPLMGKNPAKCAIMHFLAITHFLDLALKKKTFFSF